MIEIELLNKLVVKCHKTNPDYDSQKILEEVIRQYCKAKAPTNYQKNEAEKIANEMIQNMVCG